MKNEERLLGKQIDGGFKYNPDILRREERQTNRAQFGEELVPFFGMDVWNAWEFSVLSVKGMPINKVLKIVYSSDSKYIVESKSLKLYLNSFNMENAWELAIVLGVIRKDLSDLLETRVQVTMFNAESSWESEHIEHGESSHDWRGLINLDQLAQEKDLACNQYERNALLLGRPCGRTGLYKYTQGIRSNCKVTHQPDYGDVYITMTGHQPKEEDLFKYLTSFRGENHFHEEIVEQIFMDLWKKFHPTELEVFAKYTRRGGIDINPIRVSSLHLIGNYKDEIDPTKRWVKSIRQ